jgi:hypothetical protein
VAAMSPTAEDLLGGADDGSRVSQVERAGP